MPGLRRDVRNETESFYSGTIIRILREAGVHLSQGKSVKLVSRELGITEQAYYRWEAQVPFERWRKEYNTTPRVPGR